MKQIIVYEQNTDSRPFGFLQAESIYSAKMRKSTEWKSKHPIRSMFGEEWSGYRRDERLDSQNLVLGMCRGIVFFIFKMLYSAQPDGGFFWSNQYLASIRDIHSVARYTRVDDENSLRTMHPLIEEFLLFCLKSIVIPFRLSPLSETILASVVVGGRPYGSDEIETALHQGRALLIEWKARCQYAKHKCTEYLVDSLHSVSVLPGAVATSDMNRIAELLAKDRIDTPNPELVQMFIMRVRLIPHSFWFFIHHFAHNHEIKNVCFPFLNSAMDIQKTFYAHVFDSNPYLPIVDLQPLQTVGRESFKHMIDNGALALLYEKLVRPTSLPNFSVETVCILQICPETRFEYSDWLGSTTPHTLTTMIDTHLPAAIGMYPPTPVVTTDIGQYGINYFMEISIEYSRSGHSICCWEQVDRAVLPTQRNTYIFDPNNGLWQLDATRTTGTEILEFLYTHAKLAGENSFKVKIIVFRGFGYA